MYLLFYNLKEKPFNISTDPRFLWYGDKHKEALANLNYGLREGNGYVVLTGDVGMGKTTLVNALIEMLDDNIIVVNINHPTFEAKDFLYLVIKTLGLKADSSSKADCLINLTSFLKQMVAEGKFPLLIVDEAHRLPWETLEEIRLLSNMEEAGKKLINIFFVGQNELKTTLFSPECRALRQRVTLFYDIQPLSKNETESYVAHRLKIAGTEKKLFSKEAIYQIYSFTQGYPRLINIVCNRALLTGFVREKEKIDEAIISECVNDLSFLDPEIPETILSQPEKFPKDESGPAGGLSVQEEPQSAGTRQKIITERTNDLEKSSDPHFSLFGIMKWLPLMLVFALLIALSALTVDYVINKKLIVKPDILIPADQSILDAKSDSQIFNAELIVPQQPDGENMDQSKEPSEENSLPAGTENLLSTPKIDPVSIEGSAKLEDAEKLLNQNSFELANAAFKLKDFKTTTELLESDENQSGLDNLKTKELYVKALVGRAGQMMNNSPSEAEVMLRKAIKVDPANVKAHFVLGKIFTQTQKYDLALEFYQNAVAIDPGFSDAFFNLGFIYATSGRYGEAEKSFEKVVSLRPVYLDKALFNLSLAQEKLGKKKESLANLQEAAVAGPDNQKVRAYLEKFSK